VGEERTITHLMRLRWLCGDFDRTGSGCEPRASVSSLHRCPGNNLGGLNHLRCGHLPDNVDDRVREVRLGKKCNLLRQIVRAAPVLI
jgi:hypothetical protein